jgi:CHAD domain-containing protein
VNRLGDSPSDEELHEIRIRTKRVRYAADAVVPVVGRSARGLARAAAGLQEVLGDVNDAVVAARWLDEWAAQAGDGEASRAAQGLAGAERADAADRRVRWRSAWEKLAAPELRSWM